MCIFLCIFCTSFYVYTHLADDGLAIDFTIQGGEHDRKPTKIPETMVGQGWVGPRTEVHSVKQRVELVGLFLGFNGSHKPSPNESREGLDSRWAPGKLSEGVVRKLVPKSFDLRGREHKPVWEKIKKSLKIGFL